MKCNPVTAENHSILEIQVPRDGHQEKQSGSSLLLENSQGMLQMAEPTEVTQALWKIPEDHE